MGHDVSTIGNHNLDIRNVKSLALDLSKRFKVNVEYGYYHQFWIDIDGNEFEPSYKNVILGNIPNPNSKRTIWLSDEYYQAHEILKKHGDNYIKLPCFSKDSSIASEFEFAKKGVSYEFRDIQNEIDYGTIDNDTFHNWHSNYNSRWWSFCRNFMEPDGYMEGNLDYLNQYRKEVFELHTIIGGTAVVHLDDQGETQHLTYGEQTWQEIMNELNSDFKDTTINISEFMKNKILLPKDKYPLAFYDDFMDLK